MPVFQAMDLYEKWFFFSTQLPGVYDSVLSWDNDFERLKFRRWDRKYLGETDKKTIKIWQSIIIKD